MRRIGRAAGELGRLLVGAAIGLAGLAPGVAMLLALPLTVAAGLGVPLFAAAVWVTRRLAGLQRSRAGAILGRPVAAPYRAVPAGAVRAVRTLVADPATWRDLAWLPCQLVTGLLSVAAAVALWLVAGQCLAAPVLAALWPGPGGFDPVVLEVAGRSGGWTWLLVPAGAGVAVAAYRLPRHLLAGQARLAAALLAPSSAARLTARVDQLATSRAAAVDGAAAELRRIERDLHDGAQVRLVALAMNLGMAEDALDADPAGARALLAEARANAGAALTELRELVRGVHPPVLADRGLAGAVRALALASPVPVELDLRLDRRLAAAVESAAYFAAAEALANAIRHSTARRILVAVTDAGTALRITVRDDGAGGAEPSRGTGLRGIQRRLAALDGTLRVDSPPGGPTVLDMELPCAS